MLMLVDLFVPVHTYKGAVEVVIQSKPPISTLVSFEISSKGRFFICRVTANNPKNAQ